MSRLDELRKKYGTKGGTAGASPRPTDPDTTPRLAALRAKYSRTEGEAEPSPSAPVRKTMLAAEKDGFQRETLTDPYTPQKSDAEVLEGLRDDLNDAFWAKNAAFFTGRDFAGKKADYEELKSQVAEMTAKAKAQEPASEDGGFMSEYFKDMKFLPDSWEGLGRGLAYNAERAAAGVLGFGEGITDFVGSNLYKGAEALTSGFGLAPNAVSRWTGQAAEDFLKNSVTDRYSESIRLRYNPSEGEEAWGGLTQGVADVLTSLATGKAAAKAVSGGAQLLDNAAKAAKEANFVKGGFGLSAAGRGANEAYDEGATTGEALIYGGASGMEEVLIESLAGGIPGMGEGKLSQIVKKVVDNPVVNGLLDVLGEGGEEALSAVLTPFLKRAVYDPDAKMASWEEIGESAVIGALTSLGLQGLSVPGAVSGVVSRAKADAEYRRQLTDAIRSAAANAEQGQTAEVPAQQTAEPARLTNSQVERMIRDEATMREMGIDTNGKTMSQLRAEVRARMAAQEQGTQETSMQTPAQGNAVSVDSTVTEAEARRRMDAGEAVTAVLGENGAKAFKAAYTSDVASQVDEQTAATGFNTVYKAKLDGRELTESERSQISGLPETMILAAESSAAQDKLRAQQAAYFGERAGLVKDDSFKKAHLSYKTTSTLDAVAKVAGVQIRFVEKANEGRSNAAYGNGVIEIALDSKDPVMTAFTHEVVHRIRETSPQSYTAMAEFVQKYIGANAGTKLAEYYSSKYGTDDVSYYTEEMVADAFGIILRDGKAMEQFVKDDRSTAQKVLDAIRDLINAVKRALNHQNVELSRNQKTAFMALQNKLTEMESAMVNALESVPQSAEKNTATVGGEVRHSRKGVFTSEEIAAVQEIDRKSVNSFTSREIRKTEGFARKYWSEMGTKSPFFRAWFGDWRVNDTTPVEVANQQGDARGTQHNEDTGWDIQVSGKVFTETRVHTDSYNIAARPYLPYINDIVKKAILLDTHTIGIQKSENSLLMHSLYAVADTGGGTEIVKLYVEEMYDPNKTDTTKRAYQLQNVEKYQPAGKSSQKTGSSISPAVGTIHTVADLFSAVKRMDKNFTPKPSSKTVSGNGMPKVYYHGTLAKGLHEFKKEYIGSRYSFDEVGFFFIDSKSIADDYARSEFDTVVGEVVPAYLDIKKPLIFDSQFAMANGYGNVFRDRDVIDVWDGYQGAILDEIEGGHYDGIILDDGASQMAVVFEPGQIKSATDNVGTFDRKNPDIRHSLKSQDGDFSEAAKAAIKDAQLAGMMNQGRKDAEKLRRAKETTAEVRRKRDDTIRKLKEHQREQKQKASESRNASAIRGKIQRHVADLSRTLRNPTDKKHVPEALRGPVAKLLESINLESRDGAPTKRTQAFTELKKVYAEIAENLVIDPDLLGGEGTTGLLDDVIAMADKRISEMNTEELETVWKAVRAIEASVRSANKMFAAARFQTVSEAADALRSDNLFKRDRTELNYIDKLQKLTGVDMLTPEAYFHRLGKAGDAIFRMMRNAQDKHIRLMKQVADFTGENLSDVDVRALEKEMHTVTLGGQDVEMSTAQLMELYVLMRRPQAMEHLQGGILPEVVAKRGLKKAARPAPARGVSLEEMVDAVGVLTDELVQIAELLQEYASTTLSDFGNEASMEVYGYRKFNEEHYWPIRSRDVKSDVQKDTQTTSIAGRGFTKNVKPHANNAVMVGSIFDTFASHASDMATYAAWLGASEDVNRIRNFVFRAEGQTVGTVEDILEMVHGVNKGKQYLQKLLADIANGVKGVDVSASMTGGLLGNYKAASVGGNLRVVIQQPTSILRAFDMVDPKYFVSGSNPVRGFEKAKQYAPIAVWKDWGYFDIHTGRQMKDVLFNSESALDKTREASMWLAGKMDSVSWGMLWNAIEAETKDKTDLNPGTEAFYQKVAERFNEVIDRTQVVDGILQRSQIMRDPGDLKKMVTSFMGEPTKQYNMLLSAVYDARNGIPGGKRALARTGVSLATAAVMNAAVQSIIDAFRDDDREQDYWGKWLEAFVGIGAPEKSAVMRFLNSNVGSAFNPLGYLPYVKDAWSMIQGYDVSRMDMDSIDKTVSAASVLMKALNGKGTPTIAGAVISMLAAVGNLVGVPVANLKREITSFALTAAMESDNHLMEYRIRRVLYKVPENTTMYYDILYSAMQNDPEAYEIIYADMVRSGLGEDKIKNGMEKRMKSAQGVESVADLEQRWLSPEQKGAYDTYLRRMERSAVWGKAKADQRSAAEELLYEYVTGSADKMAEKLEDGIRYGVDETEYMLYKLALSMADKPSENGNYGSYTNDEVKAAIDMLGLGKKESAWLWEAQGRSEKSNPYK